MTGNSLAKLSLAQRISQNTTRRPMVRLTARNTACRERRTSTERSVDRAGRGEPERDRDDDPADGVLEDGGGDDDLADVAAHEIHLAHDHRDDLDRGDRQRGAEEKRGDEARLRVGQDRIRQHLAERKAADEGQAPRRRRRPRSPRGRRGGPAADRFPCRSAAAASGCRAATRHRSCFSARASPGNSVCCKSGQTRPSTDGPSRRPPISWPITAGWPSFCMISPSPRPISSKRPSCAKNIASERPEALGSTA